VYGLLRCLYDEKKQKALESLYSDSDSSTQLLIRSTIAEALKDCPKILESHGSDWVLCTLASFHKPEEDTMRVYQAIMTQFDKFEIGLLDDKIQWRETNEIADSCLVGLSFFRKYLETKHKFKALPSPDYYRKAGTVAFHRLGYDDIADEFDSWVVFIQSEMVYTTEA
jgi:hypothetical protein